MYLLALTLGLSCGVGCGSVVTPFMTSYVISRQSSKKECIWSLLIFSLGKILMMMVLGGISAYVGNSILQTMEVYLPFQVNYLFNVMMIIFGAYILITSFRKKKDCNHCQKNTVKIDVNDHGYNEHQRRDYQALFISGMIYGITPCAPLGILLTTVIGKSVIEGVLLLGFFGVITCLSPALIQLFIAGVMIPKMRSEIPMKVHWISLFAGFIMIFLGVSPWLQLMNFG